MKEVYRARMAGCWLADMDLCKIDAFGAERSISLVTAMNDASQLELVLSGSAILIITDAS